MFRIIRQFFGPVQSAVQPQEKPETTLVYVRVKPGRKCIVENRLDPLIGTSAPTVPSPTPSIAPTRQSKPVPQATARSGSKTSLASLQIFSARQIKLLARIGCRTERDLMRLAPQRLEKRLAELALSLQDSEGAPPAPLINRMGSTVRRGRWAIRFAGRFCDMTPRESLLLHAVHRGSRQTLAQDSAGMIRRDLQRLALSSRGQRMLRLDEIPEIERVKSWIAQARDDCNAKAMADRCPDDGLVNYNQKRFELASEN